MSLTTFSGRAASQRQSELFGLIALMRARVVNSYCEVGARHGDTFHAVMSALPPGARGLAIDLPGGAWGSKSEKCLKRAIRDLAGRGYRVSCVLSESLSAQALRAAAKGFDAILIDADHRYDAVKADFEAYRPHARKLIALHDIDGTGQADSRGNPVEVPRLWRELSGEKREFIDPAEPGMGIGVLLL